MNKGQIKTNSTATAKTDCKDQPLLFQALGPRNVVADFSGGSLSTDAGALLLRQVDRGLGLSRALARCFTDRRDARWTDHSLEELLRQRLYGLALGYEDLNDHDRLRRDPLLAVACEKRDPLGQDRLHRSREEGIALEKVVAAVRQRCPQARLIVRADSNFCREELMSWCEGQAAVYYCLGFGRNAALLQRLAPALAQARAARCLSGAGPVRRFAEFDYQTCRSWSRGRRVYVQISSAYRFAELFGGCHRRLMALPVPSG